MDGFDRIAERWIGLQKDFAQALEQFLLDMPFDRAMYWEADMCRFLYDWRQRGMKLAGTGDDKLRKLFRDIRRELTPFILDPELAQRYLDETEAYAAADDEQKLAANEAAPADRIAGPALPPGYKTDADRAQEAQEQWLAKRNAVLDEYQAIRIKLFGGGPYHLPPLTIGLIGKWLDRLRQLETQLAEVLTPEEWRRYQREQEMLRGLYELREKLHRQLEGPSTGARYVPKTEAERLAMKQEARFRQLLDKRIHSPWRLTAEEGDFLDQQLRIRMQELRAHYHDQAQLNIFERVLDGLMNPAWGGIGNMDDMLGAMWGSAAVPSGGPRPALESPGLIELRGKNTSFEPDLPYTGGARGPSVPERPSDLAHRPHGFDAPSNVPVKIVVGKNEATLSVATRQATATIDMLWNLDRTFIEKLVTSAKENGATRLVVNTGAVHDSDLAIKLGQAAQSGRTIAGGIVEITSPRGVVDPSFRITWSTLPEVGP